jgi:serine protease AprX
MSTPLKRGTWGPTTPLEKTLTSRRTVSERSNQRTAGGNPVSAVYGIRWDDGKRVRIVAALLAALITTAAFVGMSAGANRSMTSMVIAARSGDTKAALHSVEALGGKVGARISLIHGFLAKVPADRISELRAAKGVLSAVADTPAHLSGSSGPGGPGASLALVKQEIGADVLAKAGITGKGVDVAMIDSGVVPVPGLSQASKVYVGPDFTPEANDSSTKDLDTFGHGTHLAGIITGENAADGFSGVAPGSRLVSVKAATADGDTSLGELLQAVSWVVMHRASDGLNIRVLNLSVGSQLSGSYTADPMSYAVEQAWKAGIVVVAAAGNSNDILGLDSPAADPFVVAVGASDSGKTSALTDDQIPSWSRVGTSTRSSDVVAPGTSLVSLRDPGSNVDQNHPEGLVDKAYFKGSGTSQAAAVVSASVALMLQSNPNLSPDQVKALLVQGAAGIPKGTLLTQGAGQINVNKSTHLAVPAAKQSFVEASLSAILSANRTQDVNVDPGGTGKNLSANRWSANRWSANRWSANRWSANRWSDNSWGDDTE